MINLAATDVCVCVSGKGYWCTGGGEDSVSDQLEVWFGIQQCGVQQLGTESNIVTFSTPMLSLAVLYQAVAVCG